ncbi:MAG TPA: type I glyceraldehyde-3-phosphate dehydrogenase [Thermoanaerobaculia bacterium]|nr:type I glyceraldehyde-3-phosphate dehydrogenase [Thermoanaerobaculia bacterium]
MTRVGIYGFGRIGRNLFRLLHRREDIRIAAISDLAEPAALAYLLQFDTLLGRFEDEVALENGQLRAGRLTIPLLSGKDQPPIPRWGDLGVHTVFEATSRGRTRAEVDAHLAAGARRVILLAPPLETPDVTAVLGWNDAALAAGQRMVSNASSTVQCAVPTLAVLHETFGIRRAIFTTIHAYTSAHRLADVPLEDKRRGRAAAENIIPQASRSPAMLVDLIPDLRGRLSGYAMNVPVSNGSVVDLVCWHEKPVAAAAINEAFRAAAATQRWKGVLAYEHAPIVSADVARSPYSATFDSLATLTLGDRVSKTLSWFDSGYGYAQRAVDLVERYAALEAR